MTAVKRISYSALIASAVASALLVVCSVYLLTAPSSASMRLVERFERTRVFWQQWDIAEQLVALHDPAILPKLEHWLTNDDRHLRANAAYVFAMYGGKRGFDVICAILKDSSDRPEGQGSPGPMSVLIPADPSQVRDIPNAYYLKWRIPADRYYAAHVLGDIRSPKAVPILVPLLSDKDVQYIVPWALTEIGDRRAIPPLIRSLSDEDPSFRVLVIKALAQLQANV